MTTSTDALRAVQTKTMSTVRPTRGLATVSRTRIIAEVAALVVIALLLIALPLLSRDRVVALHSSTTDRIVQPGDTLWSIAASNPIPGMTTAENAESIAALNDLESSRLRVGTAIVVPAVAGDQELAYK